MIKIYHYLRDFFAFNANGQRVVFKPIGNKQGSLFTTDDIQLQNAIEQRSDFGEAIKIYKVIGEASEQPKESKTEDNEPSNPVNTEPEIPQKAATDLNDTDSSDADGENNETSENDAVEFVGTIQDLREYLMKEKKVHHASLNSPDNILKKAKELNIQTQIQ